jgi:hypothetical protein
MNDWDTVVQFKLIKHTERSPPRRTDEIKRLRVAVSSIKRIKERPEGARLNLRRVPAVYSA